MSNIFFSGDRVILLTDSLAFGDFNRNLSCEIIRTMPERNRYFVKKSTKNVDGNNVLSWVSGDDIKIDKQYYRNLKLEKLLNE